MKKRLALLFSIALLLCLACCASAAELKLPASVKVIEKEAFRSDTSLDKVLLPDGIRTIGDFAFHQSSLTEINFPASLRTIGVQAFDDCNRLTAVTVENGLKTIGDYAFYSCDNLKQIYLPPSVQTIGDNAFAFCHPDFRIIAEPGSFAEEWADQHDIPVHPVHALPAVGSYYTSAVESEGIIRRDWLRVHEIDEQNDRFLFSAGTLVDNENHNYTVWASWNEDSQMFRFDLGISDIPTYFYWKLNGRSLLLSNGTEILNTYTLGTAVTSVTLSSKGAVLTSKAPTVQLTAALSPSNATYTKLLWFSDNEEAATVSQDGLVTAAGSGIATIYAVSYDNSNELVFDTCFVSVNDGSGVTDFSYSFGNNSSDFHYGSNYQILPAKYQQFFTEYQYSYIMNHSGNWGGSCFGMSSTSSMMVSPNSSLQPNWFGAGKEHPYQLGVGDWSGRLGMTVTEMIECVQLMQYIPSLSGTNCNLQTLCNLVKNAATTHDYPIIGMYGNSNGKTWGHAMVGYKYERISSTVSRLHVYDPNFPMTDRYLTIQTTSSGSVIEPTSYRNTYLMNDELVPLLFDYTTLSEVRSEWNSGSFGKSTNMMAVSSDIFSILDASGKTVATMTNGSFRSTQNGIFLFRGAGIQTKDYLVYLPSGQYTVRNERSGSWTVDTVNAYRRSTVETSASSVTVNLSDSGMVNDVTIGAGQDEAYSVLLRSEQDPYSTVSYSGRSGSAGVSVGLTRGDFHLAGGTASSLSVNGADISTSLISVTPKGAALFAYRLLSWKDGKAAAEVQNLQKTAFRGTLALAAYDGNGQLISMNMSNVSLGENGTERISLTVSENAASVKVFMLDKNLTPAGNSEVYSPGE